MLGFLKEIVHSHMFDSSSASQSCRIGEKLLYYVYMNLTRLEGAVRSAIIIPAYFWELHIKEIAAVSAGLAAIPVSSLSRRGQYNPDYTLTVTFSGHIHIL